MAPAKRRNVSLAETAEKSVKKAKIDLNAKVEIILESRKNANDVFDILEALEVNIISYITLSTPTGYMLVSSLCF